MKNQKMIMFLVFGLALAVAAPRLVSGQTAKPPGGKPTPDPTATPVPIVGLPIWPGCIHKIDNDKDGRDHDRDHHDRDGDHHDGDRDR